MWHSCHTHACSPGKAFQLYLGLWEVLVGHYSPALDGQYYSSKLNKPESGTISKPLYQLASYNNLDLVHMQSETLLLQQSTCQVN